MHTPEQPTLQSRRVRRWLTHLWREWTIESWRPITPAFAKPEPLRWKDSEVTAAWIGHATVLINFFGIKVLTDPVLFPRIGIRLPGFTIGPKRLTVPALKFRELPRIDLIVLSHAHFDHFDLRTLHRFDELTRVITAPNTTDLLRWTRLRDITELRWGETKVLNIASQMKGDIAISALQVRHWGARKQRDDYRGYNGYVIERNGRRILFGGDTAMTNTFAELSQHGPVDLAIMSIGAYNPWIQSHCTPEQAIEMATAAGARFIMPVHHQTFRLSFEPLREPIERFQVALDNAPERIALREIGQTFVLP
ncbi:MAG TPA: MBL fold metallo-hydrolase [Candidatus Udaeobacter sp.]|nr:MBL fold metallo-hydrolase [Candidatus Udaeobacter sp.]